jgi:hypothetical protein
MCRIKQAASSVGEGKMAIYFEEKWQEMMTLSEQWDNAYPAGNWDEIGKQVDLIDKEIEARINGMSVAAFLQVCGTFGYVIRRWLVMQLAFARINRVLLYTCQEQITCEMLEEGAQDLRELQAPNPCHVEISNFFGKEILENSLREMEDAATKKREELHLALMMGLHKRLGQGSLVGKLNTELLCLILEPL